MRINSFTAFTFGAGALLVCALLAGSSPAQSDNLSTGKMVRFTTIAGGQISGFGDYCGLPLNSPDGVGSGNWCHAAVAQPALSAVIREGCAWESFWAEHVSNFFPPTPAPEIDFNRYVVVAVISGPRPNGCYGVAIRRIVARHGMRTVRIVEGVPCPGSLCTQVVTNPFHFVQVPRAAMPPEVPVCFDNRFANAISPAAVDAVPEFSP